MSDQSLRSEEMVSEAGPAMPVANELPEKPSPPTARPCRACGVLIYDLRHIETGRHAPIESAPIDKGNVAIDLETGTYRIVGVDFRPGHEAIGQRFRNHFASCPAAKRFRAGKPLRDR